MPAAEEAETIITVGVPAGTQDVKMGALNAYQEDSNNHQRGLEYKENDGASIGAEGMH